MFFFLFTVQLIFNVNFYEVDSVQISFDILNVIQAQTRLAIVEKVRSSFFVVVAAENWSNNEFFLGPLKCFSNFGRFWKNTPQYFTILAL